MIDFQSLHNDACVLDCERQAKRDAALKSIPSLLFILSKSLRLRISLAKIRLKDPASVRAIPTYSDLIRPIQDPPPPTPGVRSPNPGASITAIVAYYRLIEANEGIFPEKKDCLFLAAPKPWRRRVGANQPKSTHSHQKANQKPTKADRKTFAPLGKPATTKETCQLIEMEQHGEKSKLVVAKIQTS